MNLLGQLQQAQAFAQSGRIQEAWMLLAPLRASIDKDGQALRLFALVASQAGKTPESIDDRSGARIIQASWMRPDCANA